MRICLVQLDVIIRIGLFIRIKLNSFSLSHLRSRLMGISIWIYLAPSYIRPAVAQLTCSEFAFGICRTAKPVAYAFLRKRRGRCMEFLLKRYFFFSSDSETLAHLLKGSLGSGILAMPLAFANAGLWVGLAAMCIVGLICTYCVHILVKCEHILCRRTQTPSFDYAELAECAFLAGPKRLHQYSRLARVVVHTFIVMVLVGCCCVYNVFVATNMKQVIEHYGVAPIDLRWYILALLPLLILINLIRNLKHLAIFSVIANIFVALCLIITAYYVLTDLPSPSERPAVADFKKMPLFFGTAIFALEGLSRCVCIIFPDFKIISINSYRRNLATGKQYEDATEFHRMSKCAEYWHGRSCHFIHSRWIFRLLEIRWSD